MSEFAMRVWSEVPYIKPRAKRLWRNDFDVDDGISETVLRAITKQHLFVGGNLGAWLNTIMGNIRRDQASKGYAKGAKADAPRVVYAGGYEYARHTLTLDNPEGILIAIEDHADKIERMQGRRRRRLSKAHSTCEECA